MLISLLDISSDFIKSYGFGCLDDFGDTPDDFGDTPDDFGDIGGFCEFIANRELFKLTFGNFVDAVILEANIGDLNSVKELIKSTVSSESIENGE